MEAIKPTANEALDLQRQLKIEVNGILSKWQLIMNTPLGSIIKANQDTYKLSGIGSDISVRFSLGMEDLKGAEELSDLLGKGYIASHATLEGVMSKGIIIDFNKLYDPINSVRGKPFRLTDPNNMLPVHLAIHGIKAEGIVLNILLSNFYDVTREQDEEYTDHVAIRDYDDIYHAVTIKRYYDDGKFITKFEKTRLDDIKVFHKLLETGFERTIS